jgi:hypothetical protein
VAVVALLFANPAAEGALADGGPAASGTPALPAAPASGPRFEVAVGASWLGGYDLGSREARLTGNGVPAGASVVLLRTTTDVGQAPSFDARLGVGVNRWLRVEAGFGYARPELRTSVSADMEQAAGLVATDTVKQYVIEGAAMALIGRLAFAGGRAAPFVTGGAGYLRQLAESDQVVETGAIYHAGGGIRWLAHARRTGSIRGYGMRGDVRLNVRTGGVDVAEQARLWPSLGASFFVVF